MTEMLAHAWTCNSIRFGNQALNVCSNHLYTVKNIGTVRLLALSTLLIHLQPQTKWGELEKSFKRYVLHSQIDCIKIFRLLPTLSSAYNPFFEAAQHFHVLISPEPQHLPFQHHPQFVPIPNHPKNKL